MDLVLIFMFYFIGKDLSRKESKLIGSIVVTFTIIHSLLLLCDYSVFYLDRKINYLLITMSISYGAIVSMVKLFETSVKLIYRIFFFIIMVLSICAISRTHSRVNFLVLVLFFMFLFIRKNATRKNIKYLIILVLLLFVTFSPIINYLMENSLVVKRIMSYSVSNYEHSRQQIFDTLISGFDTFKYIGFGTGGTETFLMSRINQPYPHNLFLEFYTEYGILGAIFSLYLFYFISRLLLFKVDWHNYSEKLYALILVFLLLLYMKSFSLYNAYPIFLFIGLLVNLSNTRIQKPIKKSIYG
ncbi:MAG: O-antigen ligase family protein [Bacteroidales bacterium]|nr:O-antigen ligase family protein [Bacteroidales bacterium]